MSEEFLVLSGIAGLVQGEEFEIELGESVVLGRSSKCDICLKYLCEDAENQTTHFNTISREHVRISFHNPTSIEIEDLSSNGTFIDGQPISIHVISDAIINPHELQLGSQEKFLIELRE
jgi:pSer/pThr/pTyr-binding forkhead associated (FHA) protein